jgi:hypothetical protein
VELNSDAAQAAADSAWRGRCFLVLARVVWQYNLPQVDFSSFFRICVVCLPFVSFYNK